MPYIPQKERKRYKSALSDLINELEKSNWSSGHLNYIFSKIAKSAWDSHSRYDQANKIIGALEAAKLEFYRRRVVIYEQLKEIENGDI